MEKRFKITCPIIGVEKDKKTGDLYVTAVASDTLEDNDKERMSHRALKDMEKCVLEAVKDGSPIDFLPSHKDTFAIGHWVTASVFSGEKSVRMKDGTVRDVEVQELFVKAKLDKDDSRAIKLYKDVDAGRGNYQLSIGGFVNHDKPEPILWETRKDGTKRRVVNRILLDHIAATRKNWASVGRTRFESAFVKGIEVLDTGMAEEIFKSLEESGVDIIEPDGVDSHSTGLQENQTGQDDNSEPPKATLASSDGSSFSDGEQEQEMSKETGQPKLSREARLAKHFTGRFNDFLDESSEAESEAADIIDSDTQALEMMADELQDVIDGCEKSGREVSAERLKALREAHANLGEILAGFDGEEETDDSKKGKPDTEVEKSEKNEDGSEKQDDETPDANKDSVSGDDGGEETDEEKAEKAKKDVAGGEKVEKDKADKQAAEKAKAVEKAKADAKADGEGEGGAEEKTVEQANADLLKGIGELITGKITELEEKIDSKIEGLRSEVQAEVATAKSISKKKPAPAKSGQSAEETVNDGGVRKRKRNPNNFLGPQMGKALRDAGLLNKAG